MDKLYLKISDMTLFLHCPSTSIPFISVLTFNSCNEDLEVSRHLKFTLFLFFLKRLKVEMSGLVLQVEMELIGLSIKTTDSLFLLLTILIHKRHPAVWVASLFIIERGWFAQELFTLTSNVDFYFIQKEELSSSYCSDLSKKNLFLPIQIF